MPLPITLCIVNFNGARYLVESIEAAIADPAGFAEVLLVDNASTDDSLTIVRSRFPHVRILALGENKGPGAARNAGYATASSDLILFQDNDVRLRPGCASLLLAVLHQHPAALLAAPRVVYEHDPDIIQYDSADCHFLGLMALRNANRNVHEVDTEASTTTSLVTACFLMDRRRWPDAELFDEDFVFNLEDHDFGVRVNLRGLETWVEPRAVALHSEGTPGLSYRPGREVASRRVYYLVRNRWLILGKSYSIRTLAALFPLLFLYELAQLVGLTSKGWLDPWWQAVRYLPGHLARLRHKRRSVQTNRVVPDGKLLKHGPLPFTSAFRTGPLQRGALGLLNSFANGYWKVVRPFI